MPESRDRRPIAKPPTFPVSIRGPGERKLPAAAKEAIAEQLPPCEEELLEMACALGTYHWNGTNEWELNGALTAKFVCRWAGWCRSEGRRENARVIREYRAGLIPDCFSLLIDFCC